jgi:hypothetical protein
MLPDGKVLVLGGYVDFTMTKSCALYDPASGKWSTTGSLGTGRDSASVTLLPSGKVIVAGGYNGQFGSFKAAEVYDPASETWRHTVSLHMARFLQTATLLPNGRLLVAGGTFYSSALQSAELYDTGLDFKDPWRPQITQASFNKNLRLSGSLFQGLSQASGGNTEDSSSNYPVVQLRTIDSGQLTFLPVDPRKGWSDTSFTSLKSNNLPAGPARVTVFTNGIPSNSAYVVIPPSQQ